MAAIDRLPAELLDRIWTIAVEVPLDLHGTIDLNYEYYTYTLEPHRRRMKPTTRVMPLVFRRWNQRISLQCNGALWLAAATLSCLQWHASIMDQLVEFRKILHTSFSCDIDVGKRYFWDAIKVLLE